MHRPVDLRTDTAHLVLSLQLVLERIQPLGPPSHEYKPGPRLCEPLGGCQTNAGGRS